MLNIMLNILVFSSFNGVLFALVASSFRCVPMTLRPSAHRSKGIHLHLSTDDIINLIPENCTKNESLRLLASFNQIQNDLLLKDKHSEIKLLLKDREIKLLLKVNEIGKRDATISALEKELIQAINACTSRGIFRFALKNCQDELDVPGMMFQEFNAKSVCTAIHNCKYFIYNFFLKSIFVLNIKDMPFHF